MNINILKIQNLEAFVDDKLVIKKLNLTIKPKETHIIMGPNGSGKSTLSKILAGQPNYSVQSGTIEFLNKNLLNMSPDLRSHEGIFLGFQYPIEISGVSTFDFLRIAYNEKQKYLGLQEVDPFIFLQLLEKPLKRVKLDPSFLSRNLNEGFSGGEKKRNEILQMLLFRPKLVILDEIDSGLDIESLKTICESVTDYISEDSSLLFITHNIKTLDYLKPDYLHIMIEGNLTTTNNFSYINELDKLGYKGFLEKIK